MCGGGGDGGGAEENHERDREWNDTAPITMRE